MNFFLHFTLYEFLMKEFFVFTLCIEMGFPLNSNNVFCKYFDIGNPFLYKAKAQDYRWTEGAFQEIESMRKLFSDDSFLPIMQQSIQHKCYFAHPENVLLIALGDDNKAIRAKAANMISKLRRNNEIEAHNHTSFESFIFPDAISMQSATTKSLTFMKGRTVITYLSNNKGVLNLHEPPLTKARTNIKQFSKPPLQLSYSNHIQAVEHGIKLTTKATSRIAAQKRQICETLCSLAARKRQWLRKSKRFARSFEQ